MSYGEIAQLVTAAAAVGALVNSILNGRKLKVAVSAIEEVKHATNSMKDELVAEVRVSEHAKGVKYEQDKIK